MGSTKRFAAPLAAAFLLTGCAGGEKPKAAPIAINEDPYPSTYVRYPGVPTVIRHATVFDGEGRQINDGTVVLADGAVQAVGGPELAVAGRSAGDQWDRQICDAGNHRRPQPSRRLSLARCVVFVGRQRSDFAGPP